MRVRRQEVTSQVSQRGSNIVATHSYDLQRTCYTVARRSLRSLRSRILGIGAWSADSRSYPLEDLIKELQGHPHVALEVIWIFRPQLLDQPIVLLWSSLCCSVSQLRIQTCGRRLRLFRISLLIFKMFWRTSSCRMLAWTWRRRARYSSSMLTA